MTMEYRWLGQEEIQKLSRIVQEDRISTGRSNLELHARDQSHHGPVKPEVVIWPISPQEVSEILRFANEAKIPVTPWGAGSSLEGNPIPVKRGIVLDFTQMNRILEIREQDFQADVESGLVYKDLNDKLRHKGLFFPPDPGAGATIGGMVANNASGTRALRYGSTKDNLLRLKVVLADGQIIEVGTRASKSSSGYKLLDLFVGSEGTLGVVVEATVRLRGLPQEFSSALISFKEEAQAATAVFEMLRAGLEPAALELLDSEVSQLFGSHSGIELPRAPVLLVEFHGPSKDYLAEVMAIAEEIAKGCGSISFRSGIGRKERDNLWKTRHALGEIIPRINVGRKQLTTDVAVPISQFPRMVAFASEEVKKAGIPGYVFCHAGDGNIHAIFMGKEGDREEWARIWEISDRIVRKAIELGGTASGEHGIGLGKRRYMAQEHGEALQWMRRLKELFDPNHILNPGKIL